MGGEHHGWEVSVKCRWRMVGKHNRRRLADPAQLELTSPFLDRLNGVGWFEQTGWLGQAAKGFVYPCNDLVLIECTTHEQGCIIGLIVVLIKPL